MKYYNDLYKVQYSHKNVLQKTCKQRSNPVQAGDAEPGMASTSNCMTDKIEL